MTKILISIAADKYNPMVEMANTENTPKSLKHKEDSHKLSKKEVHSVVNKQAKMHEDYAKHHTKKAAKFKQRADSYKRKGDINNYYSESYKADQHARWARQHTRTKNNYHTLAKKYGKSNKTHHSVGNLKSNMRKVQNKHEFYK